MTSFFPIESEEDRWLFDRIVDMCAWVGEKYSSKFSLFLDERQALIAVAAVNSVKFENFLLYGGFDGASRKVLGLFPEYSEKETGDFPIVPLFFSYRKCDVLTHRDFLGSVMALQVKRETVGDIVINDGEAVVYVHENVADAITGEVVKIGRVGVSVAKKEIGFEIGKKQDFEEMTAFVSQLRLDSITAAALHLSRSKAAELIESAGITVNFREVFDVDFKLAEGDVFSARGHGKFILAEVGNVSKKGRIHIVIKKYI